MASIPKLTRVVKEKRTSQMARGVKQGMIRGTVDRVVATIADPLVEKILPHLHSFHPGTQLADPAVRSLLEFGIIIAIAEILEVAGPMLSKTPGLNMTKEEATAKTQALALWMRNYSGEKIGEQAVEAAFALVPLFRDMLSQTDLSELLSATSEVSSEALVAQEA